MNSQEYWYKFLLSGKPQHYIEFVNARKETECVTGGEYAFHNGGLSYKGEEYRGKRPPDNYSNP